MYNGGESGLVSFCFRKTQQSLNSFEIDRTEMSSLARYTSFFKFTNKEVCVLFVTHVLLQDNQCGIVTNVNIECAVKLLGTNCVLYPVNSKELQHIWVIIHIYDPEIHLQLLQTVLNQSHIFM